MNNILAKPEDISLEWLNGILSPEANEISGFSIYSSWETSLSMMVIVNMSFNGDGNGLPEAITLKMAKCDADGKPNGYGPREVRFYNRLSHLISDSIIPACYFAGHCPETGYYTIVMENLFLTHGVAENPETMDFEQHCHYISCLADLHAAWWDHPGLEKEVGNKRTEEDLNRRTLKMKEISDKFMDKHAALLDPDCIVIFREHEALFPAATVRSLEGKNLSLLHGDPHIWNFMYPKNDSGTVRLIDWDTYKIGVPANDIAYYLVPFCSREHRNKNEQKLLRYYHERLVSGGVRNFTFDELMSDYRLAVLNMLYLSAVKEHIGIPEFVWKSHFKNLMQALVDLDCRTEARKILAGH
ncbi:MAG: phosphotransferase [Spirochaetales bacterium]|nr:phosphotransferase [Spirochaetales bacterium]